MAINNFAEKIYDFFYTSIKENYEDIYSIEFSVGDYYPNKSRKNPKIRMTISEPEITSRLAYIQEIQLTVNLDIYTNYYSDNMLKSLDIPYSLYQFLQRAEDNKEDDSKIYIIFVERNGMDYYVTDEENEVVSTLSFNVVIEDHSARKDDTEEYYVTLKPGINYE